MILLSLACFSQSKADKDFEKARTFFIEGKDDKAEELLHKIADKYPDYYPAYLALGEMYFAKGNFDAAKRELIYVVQSDERYDLNAYRKLADIYEREKNLDSALLCLESYLRFLPSGERNQKKRDEMSHKADCIRFRKQAMLNPVEFNPQNMGANVNSENDEYLATMTADQSALLFTRQTPVVSGKRPEEGFFISYKSGEQWQKAEMLPGVLNSGCNEGAACLSPDGRYIYFTRCGAEKGWGSCDIYRSEKKGSYWSEPENLGSNVNSPAWDAQPTIASDGRTLFFVSNRSGGFGESDIYYTYLKDDGTWTKAKNCGAVINTPGKEMSPFIHPSNQMLYFSSDYHCGMGGLDIFFSQLESGKFSTPTNIGYPINTEADESSLIVSPKGDYAIYASKQNDCRGGLDLYRFELYEQARPIAVTYVKGLIVDSQTKKTVNAKFEIHNLENGRIVSSGISDKVNGEYLVCLPVGADYAFSATAEGYLFHSENFTLTDADASDSYSRNIELERINIGRSLVLNNIFFETGSSTLLKESFVELNTLVGLLNENPKLRVEIGGHTDNVGNAEYNMNLSQYRADAVKNYLVEKGIEANRLQSKGYGFSKPIADNDSEQNRAKNRRTEIKIIAND
jgi:outer membrane protein OmpA-like peptidoglycan-associated protein